MIDCFIEMVMHATAQIPAQYFQLPVAGQADAIYRERVYCYELYHLLRVLQDGEPDLVGYSLNGEIDKSGHPIIRRCAPDFVLHNPGRMENLVVIEVKPITAAAGGIKKDLETLQYFLSADVRYQLGIELVYGDDERALESFRDVFAKADHDRCRMFWHRRPGERALPIG